LTGTTTGRHSSGRHPPSRSIVLAHHTLPRPAPPMSRPARVPGPMQAPCHPDRVLPRPDHAGHLVAARQSQLPGITYGWYPLSAVCTVVFTCVTDSALCPNLDNSHGKTSPTCRVGVTRAGVVEDQRCGHRAETPRQRAPAGSDPHLPYLPYLLRDDVVHQVAGHLMQTRLHPHEPRFTRRSAPHGHTISLAILQIMQQWTPRRLGMPEHAIRSG
jgi:hypothetical protein